jgi:7-keto-8-aminopelargonate synthetase-like enzyme
MPIERNASTTVVVDGKEFLYFGGTNYLGLAHRPELIAAARDAFDRYGFSAGASRLTSGESDMLLALERQLAEFAEAEAALVLPAGFMSNQAVVDGLEDEVDAWLIHKNAHGSIKAAVARSNKPIFEYDFDSDQIPALHKVYALAPQATLAVFAEPIDPLTGRLLNVAALSQACEKQDYLVLDEAHSVGVLGARGVGALEHFQLERRQRLIRTGTFSKAIGTTGGFVVASADVISSIKLHSGSYKVSTPLSPVAVAATRAALRLLCDDPGMTINTLHRNIDTCNRELENLGVHEYAGNAVPIYYLRSSAQITRLGERLRAEGIYMPTVTSYFADFCEIGLRWTIQAGHTEEHLHRLFKALAKTLQPV